MNSLWPNQSSASLTSVQGGDARTRPNAFFQFSMTFAHLLTRRPRGSFLRLYNYEPQTPLRMLRASVYGRLVCVRGTVVRVTSIRPQCTRMAFKCKGGSHVQTLPLQQGKFATPTKVCFLHTHTQIQVLLHAVLAALLKGLTSTYFTKDAQLSFLIDLTSRAHLYFHVSVYHTVLPGRLPQSYFHTMSKFSTDSNRGLAGHQVSI